jgi:hypothetical protein
MTKPITPQEASRPIPDFVIDAVNELINENFNGTSSFSLTLTSVKERVAEKMHSLGNFEYLNPKWLDFELLYGNYGWKVTFDKPAFNESGSAMYTFKPKL